MMNDPSAYFGTLSQALKSADQYRPTLIIDKVRLDHNIAAVKAAGGRGFDLRIVEKSLPCAPLLSYIMGALGTTRLMTFHIPFTLENTRHFPAADLLLGKPMPIGAAREFYATLGNNEGGFDADKNLQWLIDSPVRLGQYHDLACEIGRNMQVNIEINIGLHRGGFSTHNLDEFHQALIAIKAAPNLRLSGLMGYEPFIAHLPKLISRQDDSFASAIQKYQKFRDIVRDVFGPKSCENMIFNTGGSTSYSLYKSPGPATELSMASALVMPTDFDLPTLAHHQPAAFIAAPVLKTVENPEVPMAPTLSKIMRAFGKLPTKACFIYGGNWLANPCFPVGAKRSEIFGHSSNQEMYDLAENCDLAVDDFMFFRPSQSEAVFLQFGDITVFENGEITQHWPVYGGAMK